VNELFTYGVMFHSLIVVYIQYTIMLTDLQKVLSVCVASLPQSYPNEL